MTGKQVSAAIRDNGSLIQIVAALVVVVAVLADKVGGVNTQDAASVKLEAIKDTVGEIKIDLRGMSEKIDPLTNRITALEIRIGALESEVGRR
jgi:hypothetical protein